MAGPEPVADTARAAAHRHAAGPRRWPRFRPPRRVPTAPARRVEQDVRHSL